MKTGPITVRDALTEIHRIASDPEPRNDRRKRITDLSQMALNRIEAIETSPKATVATIICQFMAESDLINEKTTLDKFLAWLYEGDSALKE